MKSYLCPALATSLLQAAGLGSVHAADANQLPASATKESVQTMAPVTVSSAAKKMPQDIAPPAITLEGEALRTQLGNTLGGTLQNQPGIMNQSFGPGVGTPTIRGQSGPRVKVMQSGIGNNDVSSLSPDHANAVEPMQADAIEVLRGPATLRYGSGAIGGIVNVLDNRVPDHVTPNGFQANVEQRYNSAMDESATFAKAEASQNAMNYHMDGFFRDSGNQSIGGRAIDSNAVESQSPGLYAQGIVNPRGYISNTATQAKGGSFGFSGMGDPGYAGAGMNYYENTYGIPPNGVPGSETVRIDMHQARADARGELDAPVHGIEKLTAKVAYTDYGHTEIADGVTGTQFSNRTTEGRLEAHHQPFQGIEGIIGMQAFASELNSQGEEAIIPHTWTRSWSGFALENFQAAGLDHQIGLRVENQNVQPDILTARSFTPVSASASSTLHWDEHQTYSLTFSRFQRAPQAQELYADGVHPATASYEIGNPGLQEETSYNLEAGYRFRYRQYQADMTLFQTWARDYIYNASTGDYFDEATESFQSQCSDPQACLPVYRIGQQNAGFRGFEAKLGTTLHESSWAVVDLSLFGDYTRGMFSGGAGNVPRMPPLRYGAQIDVSREKTSAYLRLTRAEAQDDYGSHDTATPGWWLLNLGTQHTLDAGPAGTMVLFAQANNLLDQNIRNSVSYLRNYAPEPGRGAMLGIRMTF